MTKDFNPTVSRAIWNKADGKIYLMAEDQDCVRIFRCNPDNGEIKRLDIPEDVIKDFSLSSNGSMLYCIGQSASNANRVYAYQMDNGNCTKIDDLSEAKLKDVVLGEVQEWNFKSADGTMIQEDITCLLISTRTRNIRLSLIIMEERLRLAETLKDDMLPTCMPHKDM